MKQSIKHLLKTKGGIKLDIGCGGNKQGPDWVGIDYRPIEGHVDIIQDLEEFPWKALPDECAVVAVASHVVEHINPTKGIFINFMSEVWRTLKYDGEFAIVTPYAGSPGYWQDPSHCNGCTQITWEYFDPLGPKTGGQLYGIYEPAPWKIKPGTLSLSKEGNLSVVLIKRRDDPAYHADRKIHYGN